VFFRTSAEQAVLHKPDRIEYERTGGGWDATSIIFLAVALSLLAGLLYGLWKFAAFIVRKLKS
jgi:hypothetical protein